MGGWISEAISWLFRRTPRSRSTLMIDVAEGLNALFDLISLLSQTLVLPASRFEGVLGVFKAHRRLQQTARAVLFQLTIYKGWSQGGEDGQSKLGVAS